MDQNNVVSEILMQIKRGNIALEDHEWEEANRFFEEALNINPECAEAYIGKLMAARHQANWTELLNMYAEEYYHDDSIKKEAVPLDDSHIKMMIDAYSIDGFLSAESITKLYDYDRDYDAVLPVREEEKTAILNALSSERLLIRARQYAEGELKEQIEKYLADLIQLYDERIIKAKETDRQAIERVKDGYRMHIAEADIRAKTLYEEAFKDKHAAKKHNTIIAIIVAAVFTCMVTILTVKVIIPVFRYNAAVKLMDSGEYESAIEGFEALNGFMDSSNKIKECTDQIDYNSATAMLENGEYEDALEAFEKLGTYKDSRDEVVSCKVGILSQAEEGDSILFGSYEQDNDLDNGDEDIEWIVLSKNEDSMLVVSKYGLDYKMYDTSLKTYDLNWANSTLREWLTTEFWDRAFSRAEKNYIPYVTVSTEGNPWYKTQPEPDTYDPIFLLGYEETSVYFDSNEERVCYTTPYADAQAMMVADDFLVSVDWGSWWLRTPGDRTFGIKSMMVTDNGIEMQVGDVASMYYCAVRPAMWIQFEKGNS